MDGAGRLQDVPDGGAAVNYPIWELPRLGGGTLIAIISILHVYISHLAVGGGLFLWLTDLRATRASDAGLSAYVRRHTWFFLLLTMVFGGMSGVGIWFVIALVQPQATSLLIHNFVFGWAIEWVFFLGEIAALLVYHYRFERMADRDRLRVAFLYFAFAWLSMVIINGILSFMLSPGAWVRTHDFWDGFLNPGFLPSLAFRTSMALILAGLFAYVTAVRIPDDAERGRIVRYASRWLLWPVAALVPSAVWYYGSLPADTRARSLLSNPDATPFMIVFAAATVLLFVGGVLMSLRGGLRAQRALTAVLLVIGLGWIGGYEYTREIARKPYVIGDVLYSTGIPVDQAAGLKETGVLAEAKWADSGPLSPESTEEQRLTAGRDLFRIQCMACHTVGGGRNNILPKLHDITYQGVVSLLSGQGSVRRFMPPFVGTAGERDALALYVTRELNGKEPVTEPDSFDVKPLAEAVPPFNRSRDQYVLLAWNDLGMHCISDNEAWFSFLPPANTLEAQLIKRGSPPRIVAEGVTLSYAEEKGFENPSAHVSLWMFSQSLFGVKLPLNVGLAGKGIAGTLDADAEHRSFIARWIPVVPYSDAGFYNPYPVATVTAVEAATGTTLMVTKAVTPVSTEMGCRNCHEGPWRTETRSGVSDQTSRNFLTLHDRMNGTRLVASALDGKPRLCQGCHADPAIGAAGKPGVLNFSAAMHGWHANYIDAEDGTACQLCHPSFQKGNTRCLRDLHASLGLECVNCHGTLKQHAVSLLNGQSDKPAAKGLGRNLLSSYDGTVKPRTPWVNEPDCLTCHKGFQQPEAADAFNAWTTGADGLYRSRTDSSGLRCEACHGSTHAVYPSNNGFGRDRDNLPALQYGGTRGPIGSSMTCATCHTDKVTDGSRHHPNMARPFRNEDLLE
jgi:mono/diheme cytochrome c family protein